MSEETTVRELIEEHAERLELSNEVHARPPARLRTPLRITHLAMLSGEEAAGEDWRHVADLCERHGRPAPESGAKHCLVDLGPLRLKWERHTEFSTYTVIAEGCDPRAPFDDPAVLLVPADWLAGIAGRLLVGVHGALVPADAVAGDAESLAALFPSGGFVGSLISNASAAVYTDFAVNDDGFGRLLVADRGLSPGQAGRAVQRMLEIETYRMMALLAFPLARRTLPELSRADAELTEMTRRIGVIANLKDEQRLLDELTAKSAAIEQAAAESNFRFGAARAYYALVGRRIAELREERIQGIQTVGDFMERRLAPAMSTCEAAAARVESLSGRLARAGQLLRARVDVRLEAQNRDLLRSMNQRAKAQLRLQQTVEGLSVAAISYYVVSLGGYLLKGTKAAGLPLDPDLGAAALVPVIALLVWLGVRRIRRRVTRRADSTRH